MFTGIIEEQATVANIKHAKNLSVLTVTAHKVIRGTKIGESISVNGVCLSVIRLLGKSVSFEMMKETLETTTLGKIKAGDRVNLERAMKADSRFGGHFVTGHVDTVGTIENIVKLKNYVEFQITVQKKFMKYLVAKGSVCIDGVSLTVGKVNKNMFSVYLIPITVKITTFGKKRDGNTVNVETDILARYLLR